MSGVFLDIDMNRIKFEELRFNFARKVGYGDWSVTKLNSFPFLIKIENLSNEKIANNHENTYVLKGGQKVLSMKKLSPAKILQSKFFYWNSKWFNLKS